MRRTLRLIFALVGLIIVVLTGCSRSLQVLERDTLFSLQYGTMEDQVQLFVTDRAVSRRTRVAMRNGQIYVASGYANKVMQFTSYGDLINLFYNPEENPRPVMLAGAPVDQRATNRRAHPHPFGAVGEIAVTSTGTLLVEDEVPDRVAVFDEVLGVRLNRLVMRLGADGNQIDYLGQEGIGGTFFPHIQRITVTNGDEIVVATVAPPATIVFWFSADGTLLRRVDISPDSLPAPAEVAASAILAAVHPDRDLRRLYLKVDYYLHDAADDATRARAITGQMSRIYWINVDDGSYEGFVDVPVDRFRDPITGETTDYGYEFVGAATGEHLFLLSRRSIEESQLVILHSSGQVVRRRTLMIPYSEIVLRDIDLTSDGIVTALLAKRDSVELVWWRSDRLFGDRR